MKGQIVILVAVAMVVAAGASAGTYSGGTGTAEDPYKIGTVADWKELIAASGDWGKHFILLNDIDFGGVLLTPVGNSTTPFTGVFDGNGHTISRLALGSCWFDDESGWVCFANYVGLFGKNLGTIRNLGLLDCHLEGRSYVGCLTAVNEGIIQNCYSSGSVFGLDITGGLVGWNGQGGMIVNCYSRVKAWGRDAIGGLVGVFGGGTISNCYSTGPVEGYRSFYGGLVGDCFGCDSLSILNSFWDTQTSGEPHGGGGGVGLTTAEMKTLSTFADAGWDFVGEATNGTEDVWRMCADGISYPRLSWEFSGHGDFACPDGMGLDDLLYLAGRWMASTPETVGAADGNGDGRVDMVDLAMVSEYWMRE
jgi:hypothetical protein